jgi:protein-tyrosine phosphatase
MTDPTRISLKTDPVRQRMRGRTLHGDLEFDVPFVSQVEGNLWQGGCEDGLVLPEQIKHLVSLYPWEQYWVRHQLTSAMTVQMYDSVEQTFEQVDAIASWVASCVLDGPTLVHCQAGLNRSSLVAARVLMMTGRSADEAIRLLRDVRSPAVLCNPSFEEYLRSL